MVAAATLTATVLMPPGTAQAESNGGVKVMPLGDSITDGIMTPGGYRIGLWEKLTAGGYTVDFVGSLSNGPKSLGDHDHEGHSGWRIDQVDANIVNWLKKYNPHTILLHLGTNDISQKYNVSSAPDRLGTLIDHITTTSPDAEVLVAQVIPLAYNESGVQAFNAKIPDLVKSRAAAGKRVHLVDMHSALTTSDLVDQVHPTASGYNKMANVWYKALLSAPGSLRPDAPSPGAGTSPGSTSPTL
jgi:lysophospholipase L1-like esterase